MLLSPDPGPAKTPDPDPPETPYPGPNETPDQDPLENSDPILQKIRILKKTRKLST